MSKKLPRLRIQRAFLGWLNQNQSRFTVPIRISKITSKGVELRFQNYPDCLSVWLASNELGVHVEWQEKYWDCLFDLDASPFYTLGGYQCKRCVHEDGEQVIVFHSREALWKDHLFEPILKWVNGKLAPARWLQVSCIPNRGATWAQLIRDESELTEPDRTLQLIQDLKRLDGQSAFERSQEDVSKWLISLKREDI